MTYEEQLKDGRWIVLAIKIKIRDGHACQLCMKTHDLQVHHKAYLPGLMAWEYEDRYLITLCDGCHNKQHGHEQENERTSLDRGEPTETDNFYSEKWGFIADSLKSLQGLNTQIAKKEIENELKQNG